MRFRGRQVESLLALAVVLISGLVIHQWSAQPASRYLLSVAVVDDHSLQLDPYVAFLGIDRAEFDGHTYSDKAPYQPLLAAPVFQAFRAAGGTAFPMIEGQPRFDRGTNVGLWIVTFWSATIPAIVVLLTLRRLVARVDRRVATPVALAITLGTTMLPFSGWLFGHVLAAMWVALAWRLLHDRRPSPGACLVAGLCLGAGIGTEYTVGLIALVLLVDVASRRDWARSGWLSVGTVVGALPLLAYNWLVFRSPFEVSYQGHLPNFQGSGALGVFNLTAPHLDEVARALVGDRGLFVLTPVALCAAVGCVMAIMEPGPLRRDGYIALATFAGFVLVSTGIDGLGGDSPGPRYLIPMFPLLAVPLAEAWRRLPVACAAAAAFGGVTMWLAMVTVPNIASDAPRALSTWIDMIGNGEWAPNILTGRNHGWVLAVSTFIGGATIAVALRQDRRAIDASDHAIQ